MLPSLSHFIKPVILSMLPISELRGGIPLALASGITPLTSFLLCVTANILIIPLLYLFLDTLHKSLSHIPFYKKLFDNYIQRNRHKLEKHVGTKAEFWFLVIFTGIPLPMTGAYTATILSWFFGLKKRKSILAVSLGVLLAGIIVTLASLGIITLFS
jgi:uncharacterized membrane protein